MDAARLLVAGDPLEPLDEYRAAAGDRAEWRLGYLGEAELDRALGDATLAVFPYRAELDQSGALLRALGAGVPVVVYDVGGLADPVRDYGAGRVVPGGDVDALAEAIRGLLGDPAELDAARAGAAGARQLTWDRSAHPDLYRELLPPAIVLGRGAAVVRKGGNAGALSPGLLLFAIVSMIVLEVQHLRWIW